MLKVVKFGGSSLADANQFRKTAERAVVCAACDSVDIAYCGQHVFQRIADDREFRITVIEGIQFAFRIVSRKNGFEIPDDALAFRGNLVELFFRDARTCPSRKIRCRGTLPGHAYIRKEGRRRWRGVQKYVISFVFCDYFRHQIQNYSINL